MVYTDITDDPSEFFHDFSLSDLIKTAGSEPHPNERQWVNPAPSRHRWSEAWDHRKEQYTKAIIDNEARKAVRFSCDAIYLDIAHPTWYVDVSWLSDGTECCIYLSDNYALPLYAITQLNDGWYGDCQSWIAGRNGISKLRVLVASEYDSASSSGKWHQVTEYSGEAIKGGITLNFTAVG